MKSKIFLFASFLSLSIAFWACSCPLDDETVSVSCVVRETTITKFKPTLVMKIDTLANNKYDTTYIPGPDYSVHTFAFPQTNANTGVLTNDDRFSNTEEIAIITKAFSNNQPYKLAIFDQKPTNSDMRGDLMITEVDTMAYAWATIRVSGYIYKMNHTFLSDNSQDYCNFVQSLSDDELSDAIKNASKFGVALPNHTTKNYTMSDIIVLNSKNAQVTGITAPIADYTTLLDEANQNKVIDITVSKSEVYYYRTTNGKAFIFAVTQILPGVPYKRKVGIIFSPVSK